MHRFRQSGLEELVPVISLLREIGTRYSMSPNQVAIRWLMEKPGVIPIPGAKNGEQAASNAAALTFSLEPAEVAALDAATIAWRRTGR
jgi:aryl-alcohol dehydrogenase-like predicted oxidoreductase